MSWVEESIKEAVQKGIEQYQRAIMNELNKKESTAMQVTYNGLTGELVKLERIKCPPLNGAHIYDLSIYDSEKRVTHSFTGVKMEDVEFLGGAVTFGG